jgi:hypothetical protein
MVDDLSSLSSVRAADEQRGEKVSRSALKALYRAGLGVSNSLWIPSNELLSGRSCSQLLCDSSDELSEIELRAAKQTLGQGGTFPISERIIRNFGAASQLALKVCERALMNRASLPDSTGGIAHRSFSRVQMRLGLDFIVDPAIDPAVSDVLFGGRVVAPLPEVLVPSVNLLNFMYGQFAVLFISEGMPVVVNVDNLARLVGHQVSGNSMLFEVLPTLANCGALRRAAESLKAERPWRPASLIADYRLKSAAIVIPAFNRPGLVRRLLEDIAENAAIYEFASPRVFVFDDSKDDSIVSDHIKVVEDLSERLPSIVYVAHERSWPLGYKDKRHLLREIASAMGQHLASEYFGPSIGGNNNWGYSLIGGKEPVVNLDQDVRLLARVPISALKDFSTSVVNEQSSLVCLEYGEEAVTSPTVEIPVNFLKWSSPDLEVPFVLTGKEISSAEDGSYEWLQTQNFTPSRSTCRVAHIGGARDLYARRILLNSLRQKQDILFNPDYGNFYPTKPCLPVVARHSKLISTTMTYLEADKDRGPFGTIGTSLRYIDFVMGLQREYSVHKELFISPIYITHERECGLRSENDYGAYLLNEDYVDVIVGLMVESRNSPSGRRVESFIELLRSNSTKDQLRREALYICQFAIELINFLERYPQQGFLQELRRSIMKHYFGGEQSDLSKSIDRHSSILEAEVSRIVAQIASRADLNTCLAGLDMQHSRSAITDTIHRQISLRAHA